MLNDKRSYFRLKCVAKTRLYFSSLMLLYTGGLNLWIKKTNSPSRNLEKSGFNLSRVHTIPDSLFVPTRKLIHLKPTRKLIQYVTLHFRDWCVAALLYYRKRAGITVVMCEQKRYPVRFSYWRKSYPVECEHSLRLLRVDP